MTNAISTRLAPRSSRRSGFRILYIIGFLAVLKVLHFQPSQMVLTRPRG